MKPFITMPTPQRASFAPKMLELWFPTEEKMLVKYHVRQPAYDCECARSRLQLRADGYSEWFDRSECNDIVGEECYSSGLIPDVSYYSRIQIACKDSNLNSPWKYGLAPLATLPPCKWSNHSGKDDMFQCEDTSEKFCRDTDVTLHNDLVVGLQAYCDARSAHQ
jgi:hypothetical protein